MLNVTQDALKHVSKILNDTIPMGRKAMRVTLRDGDVALSVDDPIPADVTFRYEDRTVLVIDRQICEDYANKRLVMEETEKGAVLCVR